MTPGDSAHFDAIIVGAGLNGLICAAYLAQAGQRVLLLEKRSVIGSPALNTNAFPGFAFSAESKVPGGLRAFIVHELELAKHGFQSLPLRSCFSPLPDGRSLCRWDDESETRRELARFSTRDAERLASYRTQMLRLAALVRLQPDNPTQRDCAGDSSQAFTPFTQTLASGEFPDDLRESARALLGLSIADFLERWFESDALPTQLACRALAGLNLSVRTPGSALTLLRPYLAERDGTLSPQGLICGGASRLIQAIAHAAQSHGVEIRLSSDVEKLLIENGDCCGVRLSDGQAIRAQAVVSGVNPRLTFETLVGSEQLPSDFAANAQFSRLPGCTGKLNLALDRIPEFACRPGPPTHLRGEITIAPSIDYLAQAFDESRQGSFSRRPIIQITIPSLVDGSLAPAGKHIMTCSVQYAAKAWNADVSSWPSLREAFGDRVIETLEHYIPDLREIILHRQVLMPFDLEAEFVAGAGSPYQNRPEVNAPRADESLYACRSPRTPIAKLWICADNSAFATEALGMSGALTARALLESGAP